MNGQWIGQYSGTTGGYLILNVDKRGSTYEGVAYLLENDKQFPSSAAFFETANHDIPFDCRTKYILPIDSTTRLTGTWDNVKAQYAPDMKLSSVADVHASMEGESLKLTWTTDIGSQGHSVLARRNGNAPSALPAQQKTWTEYKTHVESLASHRHLYRGQNGPWRLRTSFHRSGRADLTRFVREDISILHKHLSARTRHLFNLGIPDENGAFYNLIQHHGYPTPLLDWTYSPYVAAFFAYRGISSKQAADNPEARVRVLILDQQSWRRDFNQVLQVLPTHFHFSIAEFAAIENERMIPQQAASTVTNIDDIEAYIRVCEQERGKTYLSAIDLPVSQRDQVYRELSYMGITAGSMFPGLDGACEELKERNF
jgi:hypothetical protein